MTATRRGSDVPGAVRRAWRRSRALCLAIAFLACGEASADADATAQRTPAESAPSSVTSAVVATPAPAPAIDPARTAGDGAVRSTIGFRSRQRLDEHYAKHGAEFGTVTTEEYLRQAQLLRDAPLGDQVLEARRPDGTLSRFDRRSGAFVAFDPDGTIRTFFRPNDGEAYFRRQARRSPRP